MACTYCYVPRRKGYANPISVVRQHRATSSATSTATRRGQGTKAEPNQVDPRDWVYDIGENGDCSVDAADLGQRRATSSPSSAALPDAKASFATKYVNRDLLGLRPPGQHPRPVQPDAAGRRPGGRRPHLPIGERIAAIDDFVAAGYEVHLNFSPVIVLRGVARGLGRAASSRSTTRSRQAAKRQLAAEVIFLTHNDRLHEVNLGWHPRAEELLWRARPPGGQGHRDRPAQRPLPHRLEGPLAHPS